MISNIKILKNIFGEKIAIEKINYLSLFSGEIRQPNYAEGELTLKELEGKRILATISHFYNAMGEGYANIAFCKPV